MSRLILASGSAHRRKLLERLGLAFETASPDIDESERPDEAPAALAQRLADTKAATAAAAGSVVIGSDQVATLDGSILRKPATERRAIEQLLRCSGRPVDFYTAVTVILADASRLRYVDHTAVHFRELPREDVERYVALEAPLDCAGGFKVEGLGIALFERVETSDPTALIGLPLIWLSGALRAAGIDVLAPSQ